jgi:hypothetical protein
VVQTLAGLSAARSVTAFMGALTTKVGGFTLFDNATWVPPLVSCK